MQVKNIAECSKVSVLQYFRPSLSYYLSSRSLFCLFLRGCFTQVLLYIADGHSLQVQNVSAHYFTHIPGRIHNHASYVVLYHLPVMSTEAQVKEC